MTHDGPVQAELEELKKQSSVIRVIAHTQIKKVSNWGQKKAHLLEVQVHVRPGFNVPRGGALPQQLEATEIEAQARGRVWRSIMHLRVKPRQ